MSPSQDRSATIRFGPFEIDLGAGMLTKYGVRIPVQEQPFRVLAALLERPGAIVTREELIARLWTGGTHVDFDRGLNAAVTRLRQALSDSAETPKYIETIPKRGYRFIGTVGDEAGLSPSPPAPPVVPERTAAPQWRRWASAAAAGVVVLTLLALRSSTPVHSFRGDPPLPVPLTSYTGYEARGSLSPDGRYVAFDWDGRPGEHRAYVKLVAGGDPVRLTSAEATEFNPAWSPDGSAIAFYRVDTPGRWSVYITPGIGGSERKVAEFACDCEVILSRSAFSGLLSWMPDSRHIVATAQDPNRRGLGLLLIPTDGDASKWLLQPPGRGSAGDAHPAVSPDGRRLAFIRRVADPIMDAHVVDLAGTAVVGEPRRLTFTDGMMAGVTWTADGQSVVVSSGDNHIMRLFRLNLRSGGQPVPIDSAGTSALQPSLGRSGALVYTRRTDDRNIWRMPAGAGEPTVLIASTESDFTPDYSPDGSQIAFVSTRSGRPEVWRCSAEGTRCAPMTREFAGTLAAPRWSPDGRTIAFGASISAGLDVYVVAAEGGVPKRLTDHPAEDGAPTFSPEGRFVYFVSLRTGRREIWRMPASGGAAEQVTRRGGLSPAISSDGEWLYFVRVNDDRPGHPGIWRRPLRGDGEETKVIDATYRGTWGLHGERLWYAAAVQNGAPELRCRDLSTGMETTRAGWPRGEGSRLAISPDGRFIAYQRNDNAGSNLLLYDSFR